MPQPDAPATRSKNIALIAMLLAVAMTFIDQTIVAIAAPNIQSELSLSAEGSRWVINAYLLALAATFAFGGRLADVLGHRRMATIGILGFAASSLLCGLTPSNGAAEAWIIIFRAAQGVSGAIMIPAALAVVVSAFPIRERGRAMAIFFGVSGGLTAIGPIAGGFLTQWTWRAIFWINVPIAVLALILLAVAHIAPTRRRERIDYIGALLAAAGMGLSVLGFEQAPVWGWGNPGTWLCIVGGLAVIVAFVVVEARTSSPLIKVRIFRDRAFVVDNAVLFLAMIAFIPVFFFASVYAQFSLGFDANEAGLYLLVFFGGFAPAAQVGGRLLDARGARLPVIAGSAVAAIGFALWAWKITDLSLGAQWPYIVIAGAGIGLLLGPASTDAVNRAIGASYGEVTGITQTVRNYASALGVAVLGTVLSTVFAHRLVSSLVGLGVPRTQAESLADSAGGQRGGSGGTIPAAVADTIRHDFAVATGWVLGGMAIALGISFLVSLAHPGGRPAQGGADATEEPAAAVEPA
ncbi:MFS transporter [Paractinoplanes ferrugineus]|uniref:MFS transporter n=1 Tax=Paractinoplanes ferrugineus TaxID=113564 RepID=A0A919J3A5_9ACTN|nr:MFS transporter [Actinoplanes ferrugineus]GIE13160.1 MFS transporter [Actinoplanes ferrugineus]